MATTTFPTRDDFAELLNKSLGGENESFEGRVVVIEVVNLVVVVGGTITVVVLEVLVLVVETLVEVDPLVSYGDLTYTV